MSAQVSDTGLEVSQSHVTDSTVSSHYSITYMAGQFGCELFQIGKKIICM